MYPLPYKFHLNRVELKESPSAGCPAVLAEFLINRVELKGISIPPWRQAVFRFLINRVELKVSFYFVIKGYLFVVPYNFYAEALAVS